MPFKIEKQINVFWYFLLNNLTNTWLKEHSINHKGDGDPTSSNYATKFFIDKESFELLKP